MRGGPVHEVVKLICETAPELRSLNKMIALKSSAVSHDDHIALFKLDEEFHANLAEIVHRLASGAFREIP